jgi:hypothetical protein
VPRDGADELRKDRLITKLLFVHRANVVSGAEIADGEQERAEDRDDDRERPLRIRHRWLSKKRDAVTDGLDAGHRCAATGEGSQ